MRTTPRTLLSASIVVILAAIPASIRADIGPSLILSGPSGTGQSVAVLPAPNPLTGEVGAWAVGAPGEASSTVSIYSGIATTPIWTATDAGGTGFGTSVVFLTTPLGGAPVLALAVGAPHAGPLPDEGRVDLYDLTVSGTGPAAAGQLQQGVAGAELGHRIVVLNQDGAPPIDLVVSAPGHPTAAGDADAGAVAVYVGGSGGPAFSSWLLPAVAQAGARFGEGIDSTDMNRDGRGDLLIGSPGFDNGELTDAGNVYFYFAGVPGRFNHIGNFPAHRADDRFGATLYFTPDMNGDGDRETMNNSLGGGEHRGGVAAIKYTDFTTPVWQVEGPEDGAEMGTAAASGDLDGDGRPDLVVSAAGEGTDRGRIYAYVGTVHGAITWPGMTALTETVAPDWRSRLGPDAGRLGTAVAVGDLDDNGFDDIVAGVPGEGAVYVYLFGDPDGDGFDGFTDCHNLDAAVHPEATDDSCDDVDQDCDTYVDEDALTFPVYRDADEDGHGDPAILITACAAPDGYVELSGDCDDGDAARHPDAIELCDGVDDDCDDSVDEDACDPDAGMTGMDAGMTESDAGPGDDAGAPDAGSPGEDAGSSGDDGGQPVDGGPSSADAGEPIPTDGGCGCRVAARRRSEAPSILAFTLALAIVLSRRRR